jgi:hypothetical protein
MVVLIFLISTIVAQSAIIEPPMEDLLTTDILGYTCVAEEDLDAAFLNQGKGGAVPQTCITEMPVKDCASLTYLLGREATYEQCATHAYRFMSWYDPLGTTGWGWDCGDCTVTTYVPPTNAVPIPGSALMLLGALVLLIPIRRSHHATHR